MKWTGKKFEKEKKKTKGRSSETCPDGYKRMGFACF